MHLAEQIIGSRTVQDRLDREAKRISDQWIINRMEITQDVEEVNRLRERIHQVKLERRQRLERENQQEDHRTNRNINVLPN